MGADAKGADAKGADAKGADGKSTKQYPKLLPLLMSLTCPVMVPAEVVDAMIASGTPQKDAEVLTYQCLNIKDLDILKKTEIPRDPAHPHGTKMTFLDAMENRFKKKEAFAKSSWRALWLEGIAFCCNLLKKPVPTWMHPDG